MLTTEYGLKPPEQSESEVDTMKIIDEYGTCDEYGAINELELSESEAVYLAGFLANIDKGKNPPTLEPHKKTKATTG